MVICLTLPPPPIPDTESSRKLREEFARACFETLLQFSFVSDTVSEQGQLTRLAVMSLLQRCHQVVTKYVEDERLSGKCPLPRYVLVVVVYIFPWNVIMVADIMVVVVVAIVVVFFIFVFVFVVSLYLLSWTNFSLLFFFFFFLVLPVLLNHSTLSLSNLSFLSFNFYIGNYIKRH